MEALEQGHFTVIGLRDAAFENRSTEQTPTGRRLLVEIPDEDGFAAHFANLHALGVVETGEDLIIEADYCHPSRAVRTQDLIRVHVPSGEVEFTRYQAGQAELDPGLTLDRKQVLVRSYLNEARWGVKLGALTDMPYSFFSPELQREVPDGQA